MGVIDFPSRDKDNAEESRDSLARLIDKCSKTRDALSNYFQTLSHRPDEGGDMTHELRDFLYEFAIQHIHAARLATDDEVAFWIDDLNKKLTEARERFPEGLKNVEIGITKPFLRSE